MSISVPVLATISTTFIVISAVLVAIGWGLIIKGKVEAHKKVMFVAGIAALIFFIIYATRTVFIGNTAFGGPEELKKYYQMPPDIKVALAENDTIEKIEQGKLRIKEVNIYIKNSFKNDSRICTYENNLLGQKFPLLYESDGNVNIKRITI